MNFFDFISASLLLIPAFVVCSSAIFVWYKKRIRSKKHRSFAQAISRLESLQARITKCLKQISKFPTDIDIKLDYLESTVERAEITMKVMLNTTGWYDNPKFSKDIHHLIASCESRLKEFEKHLNRRNKFRYSVKP